MDITVKIDSICPTGEHIQMTATNSYGKKKTFLVEKSEFQVDKDEWEQSILILVRNFVKESGLSNWGQIKIGLEGKVFKL